MEVECANFNTFKVTMMTYIVKLKHRMDIKSLFYTLDVGYFENINYNKFYSVIPKNLQENTIISMFHAGEWRGIKKKKKKKKSKINEVFGNSIATIISLKDRNVGFKICPSTLQIYGVVHESEVDTLISCLFSKINDRNLKITNFYNFLKKDNKTLDNVLESIKGVHLRFNDYYVIKISKKNEYIVDNIIDDYSITDNINLYIKFIPNGSYSFYDKIKKTLISYEKIYSTVNEDFILENNFVLDEYHKVLNNYNFSLGFKVSLFDLNYVLRENNFYFSRYQQLSNKNVTIEIECDRTYKNHKSKKTKVSFLIYQTGSVTFSGPSEEVMAESYYEVMNIIFSNKNRIKLK